MTTPRRWQLPDAYEREMSVLAAFLALSRHFDVEAILDAERPLTEIANQMDTAPEGIVAIRQLLAHCAAADEAEVVAILRDNAPAAKEYGEGQLWTCTDREALRTRIRECEALSASYRNNQELRRQWGEFDDLDL